MRHVSDDVIAISDRPIQGLPRAVPWSRLPEGLPTVTQYRTVLIVPAKGSAAAQEELVETLQNDLRLAGSGSTRIVWILNEHTHPDAVEKVGLGRPIRLRGAERGRVRSLMRGLDFSLGDLHFGFAGIPASATALAVWGQPGAGQTVVGVASLNRRWALIPNPEAPLADVVPRRLPVLSRAVGYAALAAVFLLLASQLLALADASEERYRRSVRELGAIRGLSDLPIPDPEAELEERWLSAEARVATRILANDRSRLLSISGELDPQRSPYELYLEGRRSNPRENDVYLQLAYLTGDVGAAQEIVAEAARTGFAWNSRRVWMERISQIFWQTALESLHELDFPSARAYTRVYLDASRTVLKDAEGGWELEPERNRTLAWILSRELESDRILSLCEQPDIGGSFGRLAARPYGSPIVTGAFPELERRREVNRAEHCTSEEPAGVNYREALETLAGLRSRWGSPPARAVQSTCRLFPLECRFLELRDGIRAGDPSAVWAAAEFGRSCNYLVDDVVALIVLEVAYGQLNGRQDVLVDPRLAPALGCALREDADYRGAILEDLARLGIEPTSEG